MTIPAGPGPEPGRSPEREIYGSSWRAEDEDPERGAHHGHEATEGHGGHGAHGGHGLMMIACCIPMLLIAGLLVATGAAGTGIILSALLCTAMMAAMMFAMPGGHGPK